MTNELRTRRVVLMDAIDRYGANLGEWPSPPLANEVRATALADRAFRRYLDGAAALDRGLASARDAIDRDIAISASANRLVDAVMENLPRRSRRIRWVAVAAAVVVAAGLGSAFDTRVLGPAEDARVDVVLLDPLVFGPTAADVQ